MSAIEYIVGLSGLVASALFIYGLKDMSSPTTAVRGIVAAGWGMVCVVAVCFLEIFNVSEEARPHLPVNIGLAVLALLLGGWWAGRKGRTVAMTAMPQMVALFNAMGGGAAAAVAAVAFLKHASSVPLPLGVTALGGLIGCMSFSGSIIAWAKLDGRMNKPLRFSGQQAFNALVFAATLLLAGLTVCSQLEPAPLEGPFAVLFLIDRKGVG